MQGLERRGCHEMKGCIPNVTDRGNFGQNDGASTSHPLWTPSLGVEDADLANMMTPRHRNKSLPFTEEGNDESEQNSNRPEQALDDPPAAIPPGTTTKVFGTPISTLRSRSSPRQKHRSINRTRESPHTSPYQVAYFPNYVNPKERQMDTTESTAGPDHHGIDGSSSNDDHEADASVDISTWSYQVIDVDRTFSDRICQPLLVPIVQGKSQYDGVVDDFHDETTSDRHSCGRSKTSTSGQHLHQQQQLQQRAVSFETLQLSVVEIQQPDGGRSSRDNKSVQGDRDSIVTFLGSGVAGGSSGPHPIKNDFEILDLLDLETGHVAIVRHRPASTHGNHKNNNLGHIAHEEILSNEDLTLVCAQTTLGLCNDSTFYAEPRESRSLYIPPISATSLDINNEVGWVGGTWRGTLKRLVLWSLDPINALRLSRPLQFNLHLQTGHEALITSMVIEALDRGHKGVLSRIFDVAFQNRNVSRLLVQQMRPRYDFLWHWGTAVSWNRLFDAWGLLPIIGITRFPATENFPSTRNHALAAIFRVLLGPGNWITRVVTRGREGLITDNPEASAQNLAAESNGFELANRNQYGTHFGRLKTNEFRAAHRLPTHESIVRTFAVQPMATMTNNGVVHTLRQLVKHWGNILAQEYGGFAHQRMEQLNPFETLRFHIPEILVLISSLRGRNCWDSRVLGPLIRELQSLPASNTVDAARRLIRKLQEGVVVHVCGGVASMVDPFRRWLVAIDRSCVEIQKEVRHVYKLISSVELGIRLGHDIMTHVTWKVPSDTVLNDAILRHIKGNQTSEVSSRRIQSALQLTTPRDKRTLISLVQQKMEHTKPAQLLLARVKTLLQRERRREIINETIRELSKGRVIPANRLLVNGWYWLDEAKRNGLHLYRGEATQNKYRFLHVESGFERKLSAKFVKIRRYIPVAEAITRAQKALMTIELEHGKKFKYNAFMEFSFLRVPLRRLVVIAQMTCEVLDNARLNVLSEIQRSSRNQISIRGLKAGETYFILDREKGNYESFVCEERPRFGSSEWQRLSRAKILKLAPQSMLIVGGGPTGLITTIHCAENCLASGGNIKLYEARDAFAKGGSTYERAQIVRLDARWIATLRYHLGTAFEDVFIPASGETDAQLGNTLPMQGFIEIAIKDLEQMLHVEVSRLWSRALITVFTDSRAHFDPDSNSLVKLGINLKLDDLIRYQRDPEGISCTQFFIWKVAELKYTQSLSIEDLKVGQSFGVYIRQEQAVLPFTLIGVDLDSKVYSFQSTSEGAESFQVSSNNLPSVYPPGTNTKAHADVHAVVFECLAKGSRGHKRFELLMDDIRSQTFTLEVGYTHVVEAIGKPQGSKVHFQVTTSEPHGVCCIQGLKVSLNMHNFGATRWGSGIMDDIRSLNDQNTRIIGDFTKMVRASRIAERMYRVARTDTRWKVHFSHNLGEVFSVEQRDDLFERILEWCQQFSYLGKAFRRPTLQCRFFETGEIYYFGMELPREFEKWKLQISEDLRSIADSIDPSPDNSQVSKMQSAVMNLVDRLWYEACLETIRTGDVYNPGARHRVPRLFTIDSPCECTLGSLTVGDAFRCADDPSERYEILALSCFSVIVRNVDGNICRMHRSTRVNRGGDLTRSPDGNEESKVALSTFNVAHFVNYRTMRLSDSKKGYVFAFLGDEQSSPHFMRYSGLTGACINAMSFNNFIKKAMHGESFTDRFREFSKETNWSNGEVVKRGVGGNYGVEGFLRPGFRYSDCIEYLSSKVMECKESGQEVKNILSKDWKDKLSASLVPRGLETNSDFRASFLRHWNTCVFDKLVKNVAKDRALEANAPDTIRLLCQMRLEHDEVFARNPIEFWDLINANLQNTLDVQSLIALNEKHIWLARIVSVMSLQLYQGELEKYSYDERIPSELVHQPKPVDSIVDDFAVEAQNLANSLVLSAALASGALAFNVIDSGLAALASAVLGAVNIPIAFGTMTNVSRYKIRNEEARIDYVDKKFLQLKKETYASMSDAERFTVDDDRNPYIKSLTKSVAHFKAIASYYGHEDTEDFNRAFENLNHWPMDEDEIEQFKRKLVGELIAGVYSVNSYVQEALVGVYREMCELKGAAGRAGVYRVESDRADQLLSSLDAFEPTLENSLQRGPVRWGFVKQRKLLHWDIIVAVTYFWSLLCLWFQVPREYSPIQKATQDILREVDEAYGSQSRFTRDFKMLFWATRESDIASLIFISSSLTFAVSIVFTLARILRLDELNNVSFYAFGVSALGAILASFHLVRKLHILVGVWKALRCKAKATGPSDRSDIRRIEGVTLSQVILTFTRLLAATAASVALPFSIAENGFGSRISTDPGLPFWIAMFAVVMAIGSTLAFLIVEYMVRYNLTTQLGPFVCELFREEIEVIYDGMVVPSDGMRSELQSERECWEYTAREFLSQIRFDTVFAADRFGQILQYIQSGMDPRSGFKLESKYSL